MVTVIYNSYGDCYIRGVRTLQPHRLQTAMSLYSEKLSALILLVDGRLNSLIDNKKGTYYLGYCICITLALAFNSYCIMDLNIYKSSVPASSIDSIPLQD